MVKKMLNSKQQLINEKIADLEVKGLFDVDVDINPPTIPLKKGEVDFEYKKLSSKIQTKFVNKIAFNFIKKLVKTKAFIIDDVVGIENFKEVKGGAIITSNHFNPYDNFAIYWAIKDELNKHDLYKVIREGNFTSFKGLYGFFFRHCNTLPIPSDLHVFKDFLKATNNLLKKGEKILVYPEQALWTNYTKPRPYKSGAFHFAAKANVPVIPIFISLRDTEKVGNDGLDVFGYTIHIMKPIYPDESINTKENEENMRKENYQLVKNKYEEVYKIPLTYSYEGEIK